jgi:hypothetical protein
MIGFATSFRARALASDWGAHSWLLERTLTSMLAVEGSAVVVGCHEIPDTSLAANSRVTFLQVAAPTPERTNDDMCIDKVLKVSAAIQRLKESGSRYIGLCDADDLVSRRLGTFVAEHDGAAGWFAGRTLVFAYGGQWMRQLPLPPHTSGSFAIIRSDLLDLVSPPFEGAWVDQIERDGDHSYLAALAARHLPVCPLVAAGHTHYRRLLAMGGHQLEPLPFPAHLQINHVDSLSGVQGGSGAFTRPSWATILRNARRWLPTLRLMSRAMKHEFGVLDEVPHAYAGASLFWR